MPTIGGGSVGRIRRYAASDVRALVPDAMLAHLISSTIGAGSVGRIRRLRCIRQAQGTFYQHRESC
ncbi:hypothetical protein ACBQ84_05815 [Escherichia ruysiae]|uniref:hypothetical protein n=1 Tax=Escherichia ruysiae TaxID=2608867 RepID=UPI0035238169